MRGFKIAKGYEDYDIKLPRRATKHSAGYDIAVCEDTMIKPGEIVLAKTGLKAFMQGHEVLMLFPRSSFPRKYQLTIPNNVGIIDSDYYENETNDGAIFVQLYNFGNSVVTIPKNERICQGIFMPYLVVSDEEDIDGIRLGGFGSTGQ
jgi:dUTP pyrophosphatase